jgi:uncharacterized integral membrane protein
MTSYQPLSEGAPAEEPTEGLPPTPDDGTPALAQAPAEPIHDDPSHKPPYTHTRLSGYWAAIVVGLIVLLVLIVFILENSQKVKISFFGAHAHLAEGVALLLAAVIGGLVVVFAGTARILQLRTRARRTAKAAVGANPRGRHRK